MRKFLLHELKKSLWLMLLLSAVCVLPYMLTTATSPMTDEWWVGDWETGIGDYETYLVSPNLWMMGAQVIMLSFVAPVAVYSYKMHKRSVDCFYAMPIKREKLLFVKTVVGLALVIIPFTLAYWAGFFTLLIRKGNPYQMLWYLPTYLGLIFYGVFLFGWHAFVYTRANKPFDGIVFLFAYAFVGMVIVMGVLGGLGLEETYELVGMKRIENYMDFGGVFGFFSNMENLIMKEKDLAWEVEGFIVPTLLGTGGYTLLFSLEKFQKAENAEQVCEDWFGYKILIPVYTAYCLAFSVQESSPVLGGVFVAFSFVALVVWKRKFRIGRTAWIIFAVGITLGILLGILMEHNLP